MWTVCSVASWKTEVITPPRDVTVTNLKEVANQKPDDDMTVSNFYLKNTRIPLCEYIISEFIYISGEYNLIGIPLILQIHAEISKFINHEQVVGRSTSAKGLRATADTAVRPSPRRTPVQPLCQEWCRDCAT